MIMRKRDIFTSLLMLCCFAMSAGAQTQNSMTEVIPFKTTDGKIIIEATVNGEAADFVLDLAGHNAVLPEALKSCASKQIKKVLSEDSMSFSLRMFRAAKSMRLKHWLLAIILSKAICLYSRWQTNRICANWEW